MAINYPGSGGRGGAYEGRFTEAGLLDCLDAARDELGVGDARDVVS